MTLVATKDFDPEAETWWPVAVAEGYVDGLSRGSGWEVGESVPCRGSQVSSWKVVV